MSKFADKDGAYRRQASQFRDFISRKAGAKFPPEANRYHLYVSYACPWAHRTLITRVLKGLAPLISVSVVHWHMDDKGWRFPSQEELNEAGAGSESFGTQDHLYDFSRIRELYFKANPEYSGRFTVPVLWDKKLQTIVNNESSEILRMLNTEFNGSVDSQHAEVDLYPEELRGQIDELNSWIYDNINNGVYKTGFATAQEVYEKEAHNVFTHLDKVEEVLKGNQVKDATHKFLTGNQLTEADVRLFTTIVRFDAVYHQHFKCNWKMIRYDYPYIHDWLRLLYWKIPGFKETTNFEHIKKHYTKSHIAINPHGITPIGPEKDILPL
ncbi:hypothetical protein JCM33374_g53 [Metschnikowia sp. JCM 33374]|nr:hypothetical protein JCM33374_g53 [Metschnikowia sp. JCM 33374]